MRLQPADARAVEHMSTPTAITDRGFTNERPRLISTAVVLIAFERKRSNLFRSRCFSGWRSRFGLGFTLGSLQNPTGELVPSLVALLA